jgi:hypothetical protein
MVSFWQSIWASSTAFAVGTTAGEPRDHYSPSPHVGEGPGVRVFAASASRRTVPLPKLLDVLAIAPRTFRRIRRICRRPRCLY